MPPQSLEALHGYLQKFRKTRFKILVIQPICIGISFLILLFLGLTFLENSIQLTLTGRITAMSIWFIGMGGTLIWTIVRIRKLNQGEEQLIDFLEKQLPDLHQRLLTSMEFEKKRESSNSTNMISLLWEDTQKSLQIQNPQNVIKSNKSWGMALITGGFIGVLVLSMLTIPQFFQSGMAIVWPWSSPAPIPAIVLEPGDIKIESGEDVSFMVSLENMDADQVDLRIRRDKLNWDRISMLQDGETPHYTHFIPEITKDLVYYVEAESLKTRQYQITVVEFPQLEQLEVEYQFPTYTGLENKIEKEQGHIIAPKGTEITIRATFTKLLHQASIEFESGNTLELAIDNQSVTGTFTVQTNDVYSIKVVDHEKLENRYSIEYTIQAHDDRLPEIVIQHPGKDLRVMPLEEVRVVASAMDDYGLKSFQLHYRIAGRDNREHQFINNDTLPVLSQEGNYLFYLEDLKVEPGDFISYYFKASDNNPNGPADRTSDIYFLEVISTSAEFRRGAQMAGGGGGGAGGQQQNSSALAQNQKKIIAATWKLLNRQETMEAHAFSDDLEVIIKSQSEVLQRSQMSFQRLAERLSFSDETYDQAVEHMKNAIDAMEQALENLSTPNLAEALMAEQDALQEILKAESESQLTEIQMARNQGAAGGQGGGEQERNDLSELFEMEMGRLENRYELPNQGGGGPPPREIDESTKRLQELARRQERLNRQQNNLSQLTPEQQKRRLEELRREQEQLRRETESLAQQLSRGGGSPQQGQGLSSRHQRQWEQIVQQMQNAEQNLQQQANQTDSNGPQQMTQTPFPGQQALEALQEQTRHLNPSAQNKQRVAQQPPDTTNETASDNLDETPSPLEQAANDVRNLRREMEALQQQIEAMRQGNWLERQVSSLLGNEGEPGQQQALSRSELNQLRDGLQRLRNGARGLTQGPEGGGGWVYDARSIQRQLTQQEVEDFLIQPELWQQLLSAVKELENNLGTQTEIDKLQNKLFSSLENDIPPTYKNLIEDYYRNLSETVK